MSKPILEVEKSVILSAQNIYQGFKVSNHYLEVLKDITLSIHQGEMVAITGVSGSGKSTLLNILAGLDTPKKGKVMFKNQNLVKMSETKLAGLRNTYMGFIFQQHHLIRELSALENVMLPGMIEGRLGVESVSQDFLREKSERLLEQVGLKNRVHHLIGELSGGESQRTAIVRALIHDPAIVFADEPTGNLDEGNSLETFSLLREMSQQHKSSIVIVTHSNALTQLCDKVYVIQDKTLVEDSS